MKNKLLSKWFYIRNHSDVLNFTLGIFIGLTVVNTADILSNATLTLISSLTYSTVKLVSNIFV